MVIGLRGIGRSNASRFRAMSLISPAISLLGLAGHSLAY
jgi:hypothetical protein